MESVGSEYDLDHLAEVGRREVLALGEEDALEPVIEECSRPEAGEVLKQPLDAVEVLADEGDLQWVHLVFEIAALLSDSLAFVLGLGAPEA